MTWGLPNLQHTKSEVLQKDDGELRIDLLNRLLVVCLDVCCLTQSLKVLLLHIIVRGLILIRFKLSDHLLMIPVEQMEHRVQFIPRIRGTTVFCVHEQFTQAMIVMNEVDAVVGSEDSIFHRISKTPFHPALASVEVVKSTNTIPAGFGLAADKNSVLSESDFLQYPYSTKSRSLEERAEGVHVQWTPWRLFLRGPSAVVRGLIDFAYPVHGFVTIIGAWSKIYHDTNGSLIYLGHEAHLMAALGDRVLVDTH